jgi:hypothetical protein
MIDRARAGFRCHTLRFVRTVKGDLPRGIRGTVVYEMNNLGRYLTLVHWDNEIEVPVFPDEIALESSHDTQTC